MSENNTVFIVDGDSKSRNTSKTIVERIGLDSRVYCCGQELLSDHCTSKPGCLLTDLQLPDMTAAQLVSTLRDRGILIPTIAVTSNPILAAAVAVMGEGVVTCLEKPLCPIALSTVAHEAIQMDREKRQERAYRSEIEDCLDALTPDESATMDMMIQGIANKVMARRMDVCVRTVEGRRKRVLQKMRVKTVPELAQLVTWYRGDAPNLDQRPASAPHFSMRTPC